MVTHRAGQRICDPTDVLHPRGSADTARRRRRTGRRVRPVPDNPPSVRTIRVQRSARPPKNESVGRVERVTLKVGSLFSGIGGLDLGLEWAGMEVIWQSEIEPFACRILHKHWPHVPNLGDVTTIDWSTVERPDVICAGYPCQPFSLVGHRRGTDDPRHLWPKVRDAISVLRPRYAVLENVPGHLTLGGTTVIGDLTCIGYDAEWKVISAASVGAPHRRDRLFIVAYPTGLPSEVRILDKTESLQEQLGRSETGRGASHWATNQPAMGGVAHGVPGWTHRFRALGNAVVPQVAHAIGTLIMNHHTGTTQ